MDIISSAIKKKKHLCSDIEIEKQKWVAFYKYAKGKKLFLFGMGEGMNYFLRNYSHEIQIDGVIDNDASIQGQDLGTCCDEAWQTNFESLIIEPPKKLNKYSKQDIVVLITSTNFFHAMMKQMEEMGIEYCYVLLLMEADRRNGLTDNEDEDIDKIHADYIDKCCKESIEERKIIMLIGVYGSHAKQITKALLKERTDLDIVWIVNDMRTEALAGVRMIYEKNWKRYVYEMETAKVWILDDIISQDIRKRDTQIYIQVKHWSSVTLKKFYLDDKSPVLTPEVEAVIKSDGARMDYLFSGSEFDEKSCKSGFNFQGENVRVGSPRSDILFDREIRKKVMKHFGLDKDSKICLYVPTYRLKEVEGTRSISIALDMKLLLSGLKERWGNEWFLFVRLHPSLVWEDNILLDSPYIMNAGKYSESEELVAASDIMITDYSSIMFEAAYKKEPVFLYAPDRKNFINKERELLINYDQLPFPIAETNKQLIQNIAFFEQSEYERKLDLFMNEYGVHEDGHASERAVQFINELLARSNKF